MLMMVMMESTLALGTMGFPPMLVDSWMRRMTVVTTPLM